MLSVLRGEAPSRSASISDKMKAQMGARAEILKTRLHEKKKGGGGKANAVAAPGPPLKGNAHHGDAGAGGRRRGRRAGVRRTLMAPRREGRLAGVRGVGHGPVGRRDRDLSRAPE